MHAGDSYLYAIIHCIISDLIWIEKLIEENGPEECVEFIFTSLKKTKSILRSRSCHLVLLIRDKTKRIYNGSYDFPYKRIRILNRLPVNFCTIRAVDLKIYLTAILSSHNEHISRGSPELYDHSEYFFKPGFKNKRIKMLVNEFTIKNPPS